MENLRQIWEETSKQLEKVYDRREAESISCILIEDLFGINKVDILTSEPSPFKKEELERYIQRLLQNEPIQYVTGLAHFYGRIFKIKPKTLIPRPETEELCDLILEENTIENPEILEVGVGSGCIGITLALEANGKAYGTDVSNEALEISKLNAHLLEANITFVKSDILTEELPVTDLDILVSNPPYIPEQDKEKMHENVLRYEPDLALFVPNDDPLIFYRSIAERGLYALKKNGKLYFEIHERYGEDVQRLLESLGYKHVIVHKDMQGKERMVSAINSTNK